MHKAVKKDSSEMRGYIKHLNGVDWEKKLKRSLAEYSEILEEIETKTDQCEKHSARLKVLLEEKSQIEDQVKAASQKDIDIDETTSALQDARDGLSKAQREMEALLIEINRDQSKIQNLESS